jgi:hypothetical protein
MPFENGGRVSDLHRSAFWIYGVTAMVMREPLANTVRRLSSPGPGSLEVQGEVLRVAVVLALMSRLFLASGLFFDEVHLRPDGASRFPRRSYPVDFLSGLLQFLLLVAASTTIAAPGPFALLIGAFLLYENLWWAASAALRLSSTRPVRRMARAGTLAFLICGAVYAGAELAGMPLLRLLPPVVLLAVTFRELAGLIREYGQPPASGASAR